MVKETEEVMRAQHSKWMKSMQENFAEAEGEEAQLVENIIQKARQSDQELQAQIAEDAYGVVETAFEQGYERVALGVKDGAAHVSAQISSISDEVPDGFDAEEPLWNETVAEEDVPGNDFVDEIFDDQETDAFDTALVDDEDPFGKPAETEVFEDLPGSEFVDEVFDDGEGDEGVG